MSIEHVNHFLDRYKKIVTPNNSLQKEVSRLVNTLCNTYLPTDAVEIIDSCIYIHSSPDIKKTITRNKKKFLEELQMHFGEQTPKDIR